MTAGTDFTDVVSVTPYITSLDDFAKFKTSVAALNTGARIKLQMIPVKPLQPTPQGSMVRIVTANRSSPPCRRRMSARRHPPSMRLRHTSARGSYGFGACGSVSRKIVGA